MEKLGSRKPVMELDHLLFQSKHEVYLLTVFHFFSLMQKYGVFKQIRRDPVVHVGQNKQKTMCHLFCWKCWMKDKQNQENKQTASRFWNKIITSGAYFIAIVQCQEIAAITALHELDQVE